MQRVIKQYRRGVNTNWPDGNTISGPIVSVGIQAPPGLMFTINNGSNITVGPTGVYSIDVSGYGTIEYIHFTNIENFNNQWIIVDTIALETEAE